MTTRKRNEWLEADGGSDDDERGYNSEEEESRARLLPSSKRQKIRHVSASESEGDDIEAFQHPQSEDEVTSITQLQTTSKARLPAANLPQTRFDDASQPRKATLKPSKPKKDRSGIIYLSRVPPFMKPSVLRSLLTPYGPIGRIFCTPESSTSRSSRLKSGGNRRKLFLDGWVEFLAKKDAKNVAEMLNAQTIGGKKRSKWHDEVWNIRYLRGVKWAHLVEQIQNENAERAARMRAEIAQSTRENKRFLDNVEKGKMVKGIEEKRRRKAEEGEGGAGDDDATEPPRDEQRPRRSFKQREIQLKGKKPPTEDTGERQRVLSSIF